MDPKYFVEYKETRDGPTCQMLARAARDNKVFLFGGINCILLQNFVFVNALRLFTIKL